MNKHKEIIKKIFEIFKDKQIYLVGGAIRNAVIEVYKHDVEFTDLDFAIDCLPKETLEILKRNNLKTYEVGIKFGTIGTIIDDVVVEITTFRKKEKYSNGSRLPEVEFGSTIEEDLARRDFTINAMAYDKNWNLIDSYNGAGDVLFETIKCPLDPDITFSEDPLRMLRAIRFACKLGYRISGETFLAIEKNAHLILTLSMERIQDEFNKILLSKNPKEGLRLLAISKLLNYFLPYLVPCQRLDQGMKYHHKDVWGHVLDVVQNLQGKNLELLLAGVFHDIAKPYTYSKVNEEIHFYNHDFLGGRLTEQILKSMKYSNDTIRKVIFLVDNHMRPNLYNNKWKDSAIRKFVKDMGEYREDVLELSRADITSHNPDKVFSGIARIDELAKRCNDLKDEVCIKYPIDGKDIMEYFNLPEGKEIGILKKKLELAFLNGNLTLHHSKEDYLKFLKEFNK